MDTLVCAKNATLLVAPLHKPAKQKLEATLAMRICREQSIQAVTHGQAVSPHHLRASIDSLPICAGVHHGCHSPSQCGHVHGPVSGPCLRRH